ncbi:FGLLP motif-containing membrane protein [Embleya sp. NPDC050493]|uniref:FGLLP motif-containing membrane protein n=1 Tax=Embleya sp. NPDC050493 TaxID=3363989 RepID=UPI003787FA36
MAINPAVLRALFVGAAVLVVCGLLGGLAPARADTPGARLVISPGGQLRPGDAVTLRGFGHTGCPTGRVDVIGYDARLRTNVLGTDRLIAADVPIDPAQDHGFTVRFTLDPPVYVGVQGFRTVCTNRGREVFPAPMAQTTFDYPQAEPGNPDGFPAPGPPPANLASRRLVLEPARPTPDGFVTVWTNLRCGPATATHSGGLFWDGRFVTTFYAPAEPNGPQALIEYQPLRLHVPQTPTRGAHRITVSCLSDSAEFGVVDAGVVLDAELTLPPVAFGLSTARAGGGDRIRATGSGFTGCAAATGATPAGLVIRRGDRELARVPVGPDGRVDAELTVPAGLPEGPAELTAACATERLDGSVRLAFTVLPTRQPARDVPSGAADRAESARGLPSPGDLLDHPAPLAGAGVGAVLALPLVGFAAELFNKTVEENRGRIRRRLRPGAARPRSLPRAPRLQVLAFVLLSALGTVAVEPNVALDTSTSALALSLLIAVPLTVLAYAGVSEAYRRHVSRVRAFPQLIPGALVVALLLGTGSRLAHLVPGYVYGLFLAFTHAGLRRISAREDGRATALGAWTLAGVGLSAWVWRIPVEHVLAGDDTPAFGWVLAENVLTQTYVAAVIGLVFGLLPVRFLDGHLLWRWSRWGWAAVYAVAVFLFLLTLLDPTGVSTGATRGMWLRAAWLFGAFLVASVLFWAVFRLRPATPPGPPWAPHVPVGATLPGPSGPPPPMPGVPPTIGRPPDSP